MIFWIERFTWFLYPRIVNEENKKTRIFWIEKFTWFLCPRNDISFRTANQEIEIITYIDDGLIQADTKTQMFDRVCIFLKVQGNLNLKPFPIKQNSSLLPIFFWLRNY